MSMRISFSKTLVLLVVLTSYGLVSATPPKTGDHLKDRLQSLLDSLTVAGSIPGATAAIAFTDERTIGLASGFADTVMNIPMTTEARLLQGSVGKTYVSAIALQLVKEGRLDLDAPVSSYLGTYEWYSRVPNAADITVRMLMNHTSGVMRYEFKDTFTRDLTASPDKTWRPEELVAYVLDDTASFAAGKGWEYSDTNYILLGMIIEAVTGTPYIALLRERLLRRFALEHTVPVEGRVVPGLIQGYAGEDNPFGGTNEMVRDGKFAINPQFEWTGGGVASTSSDLARWAVMLYTGKAFDASLNDAFLDGVPARLGRNTSYGLGVIIRTTPLGPAYGHSGFFPGYLTEMMYFPEHGFAIAVQINTSNVKALKISPARIAFTLAQQAVAQVPTGP